MLTFAAALSLICVGQGTALKPDSTDTHGSFSGSYDYGMGQFDGSFSGTTTGTRQQRYADQIDIELAGPDGRIRFPKVMTPLVRGGKDGWFEIKKLSVSKDAIRGKIALNFINKPSLYIDRRSGIISITGMGGDFAGRCEKVDPETENAF